MIEISEKIFIVVPIITTAIEAAKRWLGLARFKKWLPILSLVLGVPLGFLVIPDQSAADKILIGLVMGASACGIYEGTKAVVKK